jgi:hypothetical protein
VITDGVSKHYTQTIAEAEKLRDAGVIMVAVGIGSNVNRTELRGIAGKDSLVKMITVSDLTSVTTIEEIDTLLCGGEFIYIRSNSDGNHYYSCIS